jgi:hypothetical protein
MATENGPSGPSETERARKFLEQLYNEKELHKQHRHGYVVQKLTFVTALFGLGSLAVRGTELTPLLFLVPVVALCFDIYIFAEDYKVKRIGAFIKEVKKVRVGDCVSDIEYEWELYASRYREPFAWRASLITTVAVYIASGAVLWWRGVYQHFPNPAAFGTLLTALAIGFVFLKCPSLRTEPPPPRKEVLRKPS